jgi:hypothetical protein
MEENYPRKLRTEEILKKCIKWKVEDTQRTKAKWEGKNQWKKVVQIYANWAIKQLLQLEWRKKNDAELLWTAIKEKEGSRLSSWEAYMKMKLLEQIGKVENEKLLDDELNQMKEKWEFLKTLYLQNPDDLEHERRMYNRYEWLFEFLWYGRIEDLSRCKVNKTKEKIKQFFWIGLKRKS